VLSGRSLLAVTSELPWPLDSGGHLRTFHLLRALAAHGRVRLVAGMAPGQEGLAAPLREAGIDVLPAMLGGRRAWREAIRIAGAAARRQPYVFYRRHDRAAMRAAVSAAVEREAPSVLYLDHLDSMLFAGPSPSSRVVADMHNVYSMLVARTAAEHRSWIHARYLDRESRLLQGVERRVANEAALVMAVSQPEAGYYRGLGARRVEVVPNGVDCRYYQDLPEGRPTPAAPVVLFVGGLSWAPNVAAVRYLAESVLPRLRQRYAGATVRIVGRGDSDEIAAIGRLPGVVLTGSVPDVRPHLAEASVVAVALESGGGTRLKILEAFAAGVPVVSTPVGCEGIEGEHARHLVVADREDFAAEIVSLLDRPDEGTRLAREARQLAWAVYDWGVVGEKAATAIWSV
jgi:glycosyltransferase involved in cell wall biosynthesis